MDEWWIKTTLPIFNKEIIIVKRGDAKVAMKLMYHACTVRKQTKAMLRRGSLQNNLVSLFVISFKKYT